MNIHETIKNRRSIFATAFTGEKIEKAVIHQLLENANWAPSHKNTEPWRFKVYTNESLAQLIDVFIQQYKASTPEEKQNVSKILKLEDQKKLVSHLIIIICEFSGMVPQMEEIAATACAVQNMYLSLNDLNIAGYWSTGNGTFSEEMRQHLQLKENQLLMGYFYLGVLDKSLPKPNPRKKPIDEKVEWF